MTQRPSPHPVLFVVHGLPPQEMGGVELYSYALAKRLSSHKPVAFFTHRIAPVQQMLVEDHVRDGMPVREVVTNLSWIQDVRDVYTNTHSEKPFLDWVNRLQPEEIHFQHTIRLSPRLIDQALESGVPVRVTLHDFFYLCPRVHRFRPNDEPCYNHRHRLHCITCLQEWYWKTRPGWKGWWDLQKIFHHLKKTLHRVHFLEAPSDFVAQVFHHFGFRCPIRVKPLGLIHERQKTEDRRQRTEDRGQRTEDRRRGPEDGGLEVQELVDDHLPTSDLGLPISALRPPSSVLCPPSSVFTFGYIGGYMPYKGVGLLLDAFLELQQKGYGVRLRLFGVDRDQDYIRKLKEKAQNNAAIHWGGEFPPEELGRVMSTMDTLVVPSLCEETYSFATREALVYDLPVVGANAGALPEALANRENCRLFERGNVHALVRAMESYLKGDFRS